MDNMTLLEFMFGVFHSIFALLGQLLGFLLNRWQFLFILVNLSLPSFGDFLLLCLSACFCADDCREIVKCTVGVLADVLGLEKGPLIGRFVVLDGRFRLQRERFALQEERLVVRSMPD